MHSMRKGYIMSYMDRRQRMASIRLDIKDIENSVLKLRASNEKDKYELLEHYNKRLESLYKKLEKIKKGDNGQEIISAYNKEIEKT